MIFYLFFRIDAEIGVFVARSGRKLSCRCKEFADKTVIAALVVVIALELDVAIEIPVAEGANGKDEFEPDLEKRFLMSFLDDK